MAGNSQEVHNAMVYTGQNEETDDAPFLEIQYICSCFLSKTYFCRHAHKISPHTRLIFRNMFLRLMLRHLERRVFHVTLNRMLPGFTHLRLGDKPSQVYKLLV